MIVGAGSAGSVIAARMTENLDREVLLLEAGPDYPAPTDLPWDLARGGRNALRSHDWNLSHEVNRKTLIRFPYPRGKVVGGSSAVNTCIALRGQPYDYDEWASRGLVDWNWDSCLIAFKRLEHDLDIDNGWHGKDGPLPIRRHPPPELVPWQSAFLEACDLLGLPRAYDSNDPTTTGAGPHAMNKVAGRRISAAEAYLTPKVRARPNLRLTPGTTVVRVCFERRRACGVEVLRGGKASFIPARQVILAAGAIHTPGILLRSGIGPRKELFRLGIPVTADVPGVGAHLLDHPGAAVFVLPKPGVVRRTHPLIQTVYRYQDQRPNDMLLQPGSRVVLPWLELPAASIMCQVGKPRGRGRLYWRGTSPFEKPQIESRILDDDIDRRRAIDALQQAAALMESAPMRRLARPLWPSRRVLRSKHRMDRWIRRACDSGYHPAGTVPMGTDDDPQAATDSRGRVRGVEGLFVADASLMPTLPSANTNLPTLMIGERIGAWLRDGAIG